MEEPFEHNEWEIQIRATPRLGLAIDQSALRKYGHRFFVMARKRRVWFSLRTRGIKVSREIDAERRKRKEQHAQQAAVEIEQEEVPKTQEGQSTA